MVLLPHVVVARYQYAHAVYRAGLGTLKPRDLEGRRVGIRSFTTTTGAWLRGILANEHGVDLDAIEWVTFEDAHVAEYVDTTERAPAGKPDHPDAARRRTRCGARREGGAARPEAAVSRCRRGGKILVPKYGVLPINHMVVVSQDLSDKHPDAVREVFRLLRESAARGPAASVPRFSADEMRRSLDMIIGYAAQQRLIPRALAVEELFDECDADARENRLERRRESCLAPVGCFYG